MTTFTRPDPIGIIQPDIKVYQAREADTQAVAQLLVRTAEWLKSQGSAQWNALLRGEDSHNTPEAIKRGEVYLFMKGDMLAGMVMLMQKASAWDRQLWGEEGHESSVYLHRLNINREAAGGGLGEAIVRWADSGIAFDGKDRIRLDCIASNPKLNELYKRCGYTYAGSASNAMGVYSKYEKRIGDSSE
ncbi:GNAT family N-acetyltransferase [Paenibacillus arenilitoris]|uniref:GNAT family N-acetyltransferase n=1 Tax=Paenibacillus arenilitoris TaxID=2772299 RepID=A0A927CMT9_9BACL|nr:GNAT family N-acetyltransferase [Paenibacillus arenilitoris]MBD2869046.1 GNAT family N-acetyltransferase [Paenibacillus arenilitoris]